MRLFLKDLRLSFIFTLYWVSKVFIWIVIQIVVLLLYTEFVLLMAEVLRISRSAASASKT